MKTKTRHLSSRTPAAPPASRRLRPLGLALSCVLLTACAAVGPDYREPPPVDIGSGWTLPLASESQSADLARWWSARLGAEIIDSNDAFFYVLGSEPRVAVQRVDDPTPGKNRVHLDLTAPDADAARDEALAAGATLVGEHSYGNFGWYVLADPQGNQFCISQH